MAALLVAAIPQFVFISASFSNDNMVVVAAAASSIGWRAARANGRRRSAPGSGPARRAAGDRRAGQLQGLGLFALAGGAGLLLAWERRDWRLLFTAALGTALPALLIAGWWYWRNFTLYGDWTGVSHLVAINGLRAKPLDWDDFWLEFRGLRYSFWGLFGWFNICCPLGSTPWPTAWRSAAGGRAGNLCFPATAAPGLSCNRTLRARACCSSA